MLIHTALKPVDLLFIRGDFKSDAYKIVIVFHEFPPAKIELISLSGIELCFLS
jgi:hypothetical protein